MLSILVLYLAVLTLIPEGTNSQQLRPQCSAKGPKGVNLCDDRPECPRTSCRCIFASRMDCAVYYQCVNGKPYQHRCSTGLLFNADTLTCDYSSNVNCTSDATSEISPSTEITDSNNFNLSSPTTRKSTESEQTTISTVNEPTYNITTPKASTTETTHVEPSTSIINENTSETTTTDAAKATTLRSTTETTESSNMETSTEIFSSEEPTQVASTKITITEIYSTTESPEVQSSTIETTSTQSTSSEVSTTKATSEEPTSSRTSITVIANNTETTFTTDVTKSYSFTETDIETSTIFTASESNFVSSTSDSRTTEEDTSSGETNVTFIVTNSSITSTSYYSTEESSETYISSIRPLEFTCPSRFGLFADPGNCFRFYHCSHWIPYHKWCPSNLHFNPELKVCDWPNRAGCDIIHPPVTENPSSTLSPKAIVSTCDCDFCELPIPDDCSAYVLCINKEAFQMHCSSGLDFNPMTGTCDLKENVNCTKKNIQCPEPSGRFLYPDSCSYFTECQNGKRVIRKCSEGLHFNKSSEMCSWTGSCTDESSDLAPSSKTLTNITICNGCNYCFKPNMSDCSRYVKCSQNIATEGRCATGLLFNPATELCDHSHNVKCPKTKHEPSCPEEFGFFSYSGECGMYIHCINGSATVKSCPRMLHFNGQKKHCDWPWITGCEDSDLIPVLEPETESGECDCECCLKPVNSDCKSFILCINQVGFKRSCSSGLLYNPQTENCDFAENVDCIPTPDEPKYHCPEYQGLFPHPEECNKFIHCAHGYPHVKNCPSDLHFNPNLKVCDWPYSAGCQGFSTPEPPLDNPDIPCDICDSCFVPDENDCASYYYCRNGTGYKLRCTEDLLFNSEIESCDVASNVNCPNRPDSHCPEADGLFPAEDCAQFIHCSNGIAYLKDCPEGLQFNTQTLVCDWPENVECGVLPVVPTKPSAHQEVINRTCGCECCFIPDQKDCSRFYLCLDGYLYDGQCSRGLLFNPAIRNCDLAERVTCGELTPLCPEPNGLFPDPDECTSFYRCSNGVAELLRCQNGTHFCAERKQCLDPCQAGCDDSYDCTSSTILNTSSTTESAVSSSSSTISSHCLKGDGLFPNENDCTSFYQCFEGRAYFIKCPSGLHFSYKDEVCEHPCIANCDHKIDCMSSTTVIASTSTESTFSSSSSTVSPHCVEDDGLFANEDDCTSFYQCSSGRAYLIKCPSGLHFSYKDQVCEHPCRANCSQTIDCTAPSTSRPTSSSAILSPNCPQESGLFPNTEDCTTFYQCSAGQAYLVKCPSRLHFSFEHQICEHPCKANCDPTIGDCSSTTTSSIITQQSTLSPHCLSTDGIFPTIDDCTAFYLCSHGKEHLIHCPPGLHYSQKHESCEDPYIACCNSSIDCSTTTKEEASTSISSISPECMDSDGLFPNPDDCESFYQCSNGRSHLIQCPSGLHFSPDDEVCERPCIAGCNISIACPTEIPDAEGNCTCEDCYLPDPDDCSAFYFCNDRRLTKSYCPYRMLFDKNTGYCENENTVDCEANGDPSMCPKPFGFFSYPGDCKKFIYCDNSIAHIKKCDGNLEFDPINKICTRPKGYCGGTILDRHCIHPTGLFPDPKNCSLFYHCEHGVAYLKHCSSPLKFNPITEVCDWPENVDCGQDTENTSSSTSTDVVTTRPYSTDATQSSTYSSSTSTTSPITSTSEPCYKVPGVICPCACRVPTYDECSSFFQCLEDGTACKKYCPEGLYFNKREMVCDLPSNVECRDFFFTTIKKTKLLSQPLHSSTKLVNTRK